MRGRRWPSYFLLACGCAIWTFAGASSRIELSGEWQVRLTNVCASVALPGTLADVGLGTRWTREMFETTKDRPQSGALTREYQYLGEAVYTRTFDLPADATERPLELFLERVMWASEVTLDGRKVGACDSLSTPHVCSLGKMSPGRHEISVRVDNSCRYGFSRNSHSYGPSGQSVWHGILGRVELRPVDPFAAVKVDATAPSGGKLTVTGLPADFEGTVEVEDLPTREVARERGRLTLALDAEPVWWSEDSPRLYTLVIGDGKGHGVEVTRKEIRFGFHTYSTVPHAVTVNGARTFLRANIDNCLFPKLGRPPMTKREWLDILRVLKEEDGFNAIRFHSWCPPEAAFEAADELGVYLQPEVCIWSDTWMKPAPQHVGWGDPVDGFVRREFRAICDAYGNHPSFLSLAVGNELGGSNWDEAERIVHEMRAYEPRILHFFSSARKIVPSDQLTATHCIPGVGMCRERLFPNTDWDYEDVYSKVDIPVVAHEIGQWPTYPDFGALLPKFNGVMRPWNIDRCEARSRQEGTDRFRREYMIASAYQGRLIYKDEVESFLRTSSCAGIHLLDAQDYTGEGEALMGWRDPFFALKSSYRAMKPFRTLWAKAAVLARLSKYDWCAGETFKARMQVRNMTGGMLRRGREFPWTVVTDAGRTTVTHGVLRLSDDVVSGGLGELGDICLALAVPYSSKLELRCGESVWPFWVFPKDERVKLPEDVTVTGDFATMRKALVDGGTVLYTGESRETARDSFKPVYWSSVWFPSKQPLKETLGTWFEKDHPMLKGFPTEEHADWQWYGLVNGACIHRLMGLPETFRPVALAVSDFHFSMQASPLFELRVGKGRLVVCGYDLGAETPAAKRLRACVYGYLGGNVMADTVSVPLGWLDESFAPGRTGAEGPTKVVHREKVDFVGRVFERSFHLNEPVTGTVELVFAGVDGGKTCAASGSIDGHPFDVPSDSGRCIVRVGIIREDMLDGELVLRWNTPSGNDLKLISLAVEKDR